MLRNKEFRQFTLCFLAIAISSILIGFAMNTAAGILAIIAAVAFGITFYAFTKARYNSIAQISSQIDLVLHNIDTISIGDCEEGELSILNSEITKMTLRMREQNEALRKEKEHLANSLADIAHQLRTPLTSVNLILSLLANNPNENEKKSFTREAETLLVQMDWLITSLLKLSRLDAGIVVFQKEPIEGNHLINTALRPLLIPLELHNIEIKTNVQEMIIQGDIGWLSEAIQNIIKNCMESIGNSGKIEIIATDTPLFAEISIKDSGTGFEEEDVFLLFDRFYRGKKQNTSGYGIGLALSKMIITRHDGTIAAKNHSQGGAVFVIRFPK